MDYNPNHFTPNSVLPAFRSPKNLRDILAPSKSQVHNLEEGSPKEVVTSAKVMFSPRFVFLFVCLLPGYLKRY